MKVKRQKRANRYMDFFKNSFGFHEPFQVLLDGTFCMAALKGKVDVKHQVAKYLGGATPAIILTTCCAVMETDKLGTAVRGAALILKKFPAHKCGHEKSPISASKCLQSMVSKGNKRHYIIATQDRMLRDKLRHWAGVPLMYVHYRSPMLEKPSQANELAANDIAQSCELGSQFQIRQLRLLKKRILGEDDDATTKQKTRKRKRMRGPNPLSIKTKLNNDGGPVETNEADNTVKPKRRKRYRVKLAKHVKEHLQEHFANASAPRIIEELSPRHVLR